MGSEDGKEAAIELHGRKPAQEILSVYCACFLPWSLLTVFATYPRKLSLEPTRKYSINFVPVDFQ